MIFPEQALKLSDQNHRAAVRRLEEAVDRHLGEKSDRPDEKWPVFVSEAEDHDPRDVLALIPGYVERGWVCWYRPDGFLYLAPPHIAAGIDDTQFPHDSMGKRYQCPTKTTVPCSTQSPAPSASATPPKRFGKRFLRWVLDSIYNTSPAQSRKK